jgi:serine O-acetyltransferase
MNFDDHILFDYQRSRKFFLDGNITAAEFYYSLNRSSNAIDLFYEVELPEHVKFVHPFGTVLGRATYGDYLVVYHGCGVGSDLDGNRPVLGSGVVLFPGAKVLGKTTIGDNVFITANTVVQNCVIPSNSVVFPAARDFEARGGARPVTCGWKPTRRSVVQYYFKGAPDAKVH